MIMECSVYLFLFSSLVLLCHFMALSHTYPSSMKEKRCHDDEMAALLQFKNSFVITNSCHSNFIDGYPKVESWKGGGDCCVWDGVECDDQTYHVISIDLSLSCLHGSINSSSTLFSLVHLQKLNLAYNDFSFSQIPSEIGELSSLTHLNLSYSSFSGQIPQQLLNITTLVSLDLSSGFQTFPQLELHRPSLRGLVQHLIKLKELHLSNVNISSGVPNLLSKFSSLESLHLDGCDLYGEFPVAIFHLPKLKALDLSVNNDLKGYLPNFHIGSPLKSLMLSYTNFGGELPPSIGNLACLENLHIDSCSFTGKLPTSLGNLTQLVSLEYIWDGNHFNSDTFTTSSLSWIGKLTKLDVLDLSSKNLKGEIPSWLMNLTQLIELRLNDNQLTGPIPSWLMNLPQIKYFELSKNQLSGQLPSQMNHLIEYLYLSSNKLEGSISNLSNLHNLQYLTLHGNRFVGSVDLSLFFPLKNLSVLTLSYNNLSLSIKNTSTTPTFPSLRVLGLASCELSEFPAFLHNKSLLEFLDLSDNNIRGQIPSWICDLAKILIDGSPPLHLNLSHNLLTGFERDRPVFLPGAQIQTLDLSYNMLQGSLPIPPPSTSSYLISNNNLSGEVSHLICNLTSLENLDLSFNNLSGKLPQCLSNFSDSLSVLELKENKFDGNIPSTWRNGCQLRMISMGHNQLHGHLPRSLANCSLLEFVDLGNNHITDTFPLWLGLGTATRLSVLILRSNGFHGMINDFGGIGFSNLRVIDLSNNEFRGELPSKFIETWNPMKASNATQVMAYMDKSLAPNFKIDSVEYGSFDYSMTIHNKGLELNYMKIPDIFCAIDFSSNNFEGQIPNIIGGLAGLQLLNLSSNLLTGHIPSSLSNMKDIECLDLSRNQLSGHIPMDLTKLTYLSSFDVSFNILSGPIPQGNQFCNFDPKSYDGNPGLSIETWTKQCGNLKSVPQLQHQPPSIAADDDDDDSGTTFKMKWMIISIGFIGGLVVGVTAGNEFTRRKHYWFVNTFGRKKRS